MGLATTSSPKARREESGQRWWKVVEIGSGVSGESADVHVERSGEHARCYVPRNDDREGWGGGGGESGSQVERRVEESDAERVRVGVEELGEAFEEGAVAAFVNRSKEQREADRVKARASNL